MSLQKQKEYTQGFLDALRVVQSTNNFDFNGVSSPVVPQLTPTSFSPITPANQKDMQAIMMSILGTPISAPGANMVDELSMQILASTGALPGPNLIHLSPTQIDSFITDTNCKNTTSTSSASDSSSSSSSSNSNSSTSSITTSTTATTTSINSLPIINSSSSSAASTSRPNKLNLTPPLISYDPNNSDSDSGGAETRSTSRSGRFDEMGLDDQEKKKLERKRARNRQAASKCRQKKMDRIKELEESVTYEKQKMARLDSEIHQLRSTLNSFQSIVERHINSGCQTASCRI